MVLDSQASGALAGSRGRPSRMCVCVWLKLKKEKEYRSPKGSNVYSFAISKVQRKVRQLSKVAQDKNRQKLLHKASNLEKIKGKNSKTGWKAILQRELRQSGKQVVDNLAYK